MRVVFFGSPDFAVPILRRLAMEPGFDVRLVVTQGAKGPSPVALVATELGLPVFTPETLRHAAVRERLAAVEADVFVVAAFGLIFRQATLALPRLGCVNVHPSLLPKYRGASPIPAAIAAGETTTGVSLMVMDAGIDTGTVISRVDARIDAEDTSESLAHRLAGIGAAQLVRDLPRWARGELVTEPQSEAEASLTRTLTKADGWVDWRRSATEIERHVRAMWPWPRAWTTVDGSPLQIHRAAVVASDAADVAPGTAIEARRQIVVACGSGAVELMTVEPAGRRAMTGGAYLNGRRAPLERLGDAGAPEPVPPLVVPVVRDARG